MNNNIHSNGSSFQEVEKCNVLSSKTTDDRSVQNNDNQVIHIKRRILLLTIITYLKCKENLRQSQSKLGMTLCIENVLITGLTKTEIVWIIVHSFSSEVKSFSMLKKYFNQVLRGWYGDNCDCIYLVSGENFMIKFPWLFLYYLLPLFLTTSSHLISLNVVVRRVECKQYANLHHQIV